MAEFILTGIAGLGSVWFESRIGEQFTKEEIYMKMG